MTVATFDTCAAARALREAGFDDHQAEAAVAMVRDAMAESVAGEADLAAAVADLKAAVAEVKAVIADLKADTIKVAIGMTIANVALTVSLIMALV